MKTLKFLILMLLLAGVIGCKKDEPVDIKNLDVERYIELLKANRYDSNELPPFTYKDIPALLKYRNEAQMISDFPRNWISSLWGPDCKLGVYVLWTVESIRAVAIGSKYLVGRFPSQNPILFKRDDGSQLAYDNGAYDIAAQAYFKWWEENKQKDFNEFKNMDPLEKTNYEWH